jgi:hypothetical protein
VDDEEIDVCGDRLGIKLIPNSDNKDVVLGGTTGSSANQMYEFEKI